MNISIIVQWFGTLLELLKGRTKKPFVFQVVRRFVSEPLRISVLQNQSDKMNRIAGSFLKNIRRAPISTIFEGFTTLLIGKGIRGCELSRSIWASTEKRQINSVTQLLIGG